MDDIKNVQVFLSDAQQHASRAAVRFEWSFRRRFVEHMTPVVLVLRAFEHELLPLAFSSSHALERLASAAKAQLLLHPVRFVPLVNLKVPYSKFWAWLPVQIALGTDLQVQKASRGLLPPKLFTTVQMPVEIEDALLANHKEIRSSWS